MFTSVLDYGADKFGLQPSESAFNQAATIAATNNEWTVNVPTGTYLLNGNPGSTNTVWLLTSGVSFTGTGTLNGKVIITGPRGTAETRTMKIGPYEPIIETQSRLNAHIDGELTVTSGRGSIAAYFGTQSLNNPQEGSMGCIGTATFVINNNDTAVQSVYGSYIEVTRHPNTGVSHGMEIDVTNRGNRVKSYPYAIGATGMTNGIWVASGGEHAVSPATLAIGIVDNGSPWETGIMFSGNSLVTETGEGLAIGMCEKHAIGWFNSQNKEVAKIRSDATTDSLGLVFGNGILTVQDLSGNIHTTFNTDGRVQSPTVMRLSSPEISLESSKINFKTAPVVTVGRQGVAQALPPNPAGYLKVLIGGDYVVIPFYRP